MYLKERPVMIKRGKKLVPNHVRSRALTKDVEPSEITIQG
jgi:hypothetical protein